MLPREGTTRTSASATFMKRAKEGPWARTGTHFSVPSSAALSHRPTFLGLTILTSSALDTLGFVVKKSCLCKRLSQLLRVTRVDAYAHAQPLPWLNFDVLFDPAQAGGTEDTRDQRCCRSVALFIHTGTLPREARLELQSVTSTLLVG